MKKSVCLGNLKEGEACQSALGSRTLIPRENLWDIKRSWDEAMILKKSDVIEYLSNNDQNIWIYSRIKQRPPVIPSTKMNFFTHLIIFSINN